ncbi:hypothetical protein [uncultured Bacteroides sp.]|jgi:ABC-type uncharacterized transport system permease subunit|uniref:hypothetical protein n=1 Tax=uncultured Bacteroides sp. TaxID=162156 RepID=UPI002AA6BA78|nr:hypothetical protein [uncultured Bacteroides sp.]
MKTNQDKDSLLKEVLRKSSSESLPFNFTNRMMEQINAEAQKKQRRAAGLNLCFLLLASASLIGLATYLLMSNFSFNIIESLRNISFSSESGSIFGFYFYIGLLVLGLLGLDYYLRKLKHHS